MPRRKKKAKVIAEPSVPLENLAKAELGAWESSAPTLLRKFQEKLRELRPVDEEATELLSSLEAQRGAYLKELRARWLRLEAGEELELDEKESRASLEHRCPVSRRPKTAARARGCRRSRLRHQQQ